MRVLMLRSTRIDLSMIYTFVSGFWCTVNVVTEQPPLASILNGPSVDVTMNQTPTIDIQQDFPQWIYRNTLFMSNLMELMVASFYLLLVNWLHYGWNPADYPLAHLYVNYDQGSQFALLWLGWKLISLGWSCLLMSWILPLPIDYASFCFRNSFTVVVASTAGTMLAPCMLLNRWFNLF